MRTHREIVVRKRENSMIVCPREALSQRYSGARFRQTLLYAVKVRSEFLYIYILRKFSALVKVLYGVNGHIPILNIRIYNTILHVHIYFLSPVIRKELSKFLYCDYYEKHFNFTIRSNGTVEIEKVVTMWQCDMYNVFP